MFTVFCDFDGTITLEDSTDLLLSRLASPEWLVIEEEWEAGKIGSGECMERQIALIRGGTAAMAEVLAEVQVDSSFHSFVESIRSRKGRVYVVSEGIDWVINTIFAREGICVDGIVANSLVESAGAVSLKRGFSRPACSSGVCKCDIFSRWCGNGKTAVVGDGLSDLCWSERAQYLFAKKKLLAHCRERLIPHIPFSTFADIKACLEATIFPTSLSGYAGEGI